MTNPIRPVSQGTQETASVNSGRSGVFPPGFDLSEFSTYARSSDLVSAVYAYIASIRLNILVFLAFAHRSSLVPY